MDVCRLCLEIEGNCAAIDDSNRSQIGIFLPEVAIDSVERSVLCPGCALALRDMHEFRLKCLRTEAMIEKFIESNNLAGPLDLKSVIDDAQKLFVQWDAEDDVKVNDLHFAVEIKQEIHEESVDNLEETNGKEMAKQGAIAKCEDRTSRSKCRPKRRQVKFKEDCEACGKPFSKDSALRVHLANVHGHTDETGQHKCKHCDSVFYTERALVRHRTMHSIKTEFLISSSDDRNLPRKRAHTFVKPDGRGRKKRRPCRGCYRALRLMLTSREADKKVRRVTSYCTDCDGQPGFCLHCFNESHK